jgi:hypothetical protein
MSTNSPTPSQTFALSMFANAVQNISGPDLGPSAFSQINQALSNASSGAGSIGSWKIVWGPVVLTQQVDSANSVNLMYVVQSDDHPSQFVIAIAGTNFSAMIDSVVEDCFVSLQVPWIYNADAQAQGAKIGLGTAIGLFNLQNLTPDAKLPGGGQTLGLFLAGLDLLSGLVGQKVQVTVAGHSLGGALASVVALWLADTQSQWDPGANATVAAHTFAGPTAGNSAFASYAGRKLGALLVPYYNSLDAIPHAWREGTNPPTNGDPPSLSDLFGIYVSNIPPDGASTFVVLLINVLQLLAQDGDYATLPNLQKITGTFNSVIDSKAKPDSFDRYLAQVGYQHIGGYYSTFSYNPNWMPGMPQKPVCMSPWLAGTLQAASSAASVAQALQNQKPQKIAVAGAVVDMPRGPNDPQAARVVALVQAGLAKQGKRSPAA